MLVTKMANHGRPEINTKTTISIHLFPSWWHLTGLSGTHATSVHLHCDDGMQEVASCGPIQWILWASSKEWESGEHAFPVWRCWNQSLFSCILQIEGKLESWAALLPAFHSWGWVADWVSKQWACTPACSACCHQTQDLHPWCSGKLEQTLGAGVHNNIWLVDKTDHARSSNALPSKEICLLCDCRPDLGCWWCQQQWLCSLCYCWCWRVCPWAWFLETSCKHASQVWHWETHVWIPPKA